MSVSSHRTDLLIVGGGLAGAMAGLRLAAAGRQVTILERERAPHHKVCGEFLSREAVEYLCHAGVNPLSLGAKAIRFVRLAAKRRVVEAKLPFTALSLSRCVLDEALLARASEAGCHVLRGASVACLTSDDGLWLAELHGGAIWSTPIVFLATGKHDLRGLERQPGRHGDMVGFKLHWRLADRETEAVREWMELFLFEGGYGGLSLVEGDAANLCLVVRRANLRKQGGWQRLLDSILRENIHLAGRMRGATPLWERPLAVSSIPYGRLEGRSGLWCVGDQAACIPSFTGDGMSIALHSGALAAQMVLAGESASGYHRLLQAHLGGGMGLATVLSRALVTGAGRALAPVALSLFPHAMNWIAASTRIPERALHETRGLAQAERGPALL